LALDESFDGHDSVVKEAAFDLLRQYAKDRLVMVITHAVDVKDFVDKMETIEYNGICSWVKPG
jgi:ABC-type Mn2+/Zn2+ transport system ATPase subunit